jgi:protocatechuate 3,4-dioxygenase, beta subunit
MKRFSRRWILSIGSLASLSLIIARTHAKSLAKICRVTPRQVLGPFYAEKWQSNNSWQADLTKVENSKKSAQGEQILLQGKVQEVNCRPIAGAKVQLWQANSQGRYHHSRDAGNKNPIDSGFKGWAEVMTNKNGEYSFKTIIPGTYEASPGWTRPAHLHFKVIKPGFEPLVTQMYFSGRAHQASDHILQGVPKKDRSKLIIKFNFNEKTKISSGQFNMNLRNANSYI